jgi:hypothetical protein
MARRLKHRMERTIAAALRSEKRLDGAEIPLHFD